MSTTTLSLADVARLAGVRRPVVSMWRKRPVEGAPFPELDAHQRVDADALVAWLELTGRGNNPDARADLALQQAVSAHTDTQAIRDLVALIAASALVDSPLPTDPEDLVDLADELDPDDEWLFSEIAHAGIANHLPTAAAITASAWRITDAHDQLLAELVQRGALPATTSGDLTRLVADFLVATARSGALLVDAVGSATDAILRACDDESIDGIRVMLTGTGPAVRLAHQRYETRHLAPARRELDDDWNLATGSVVVAHLPGDRTDAFDLLDEIAAQLTPNVSALVTGPASLLIDPLPDTEVARRDTFLRQRLVVAAARLPQGLTEPRTRRHEALWLLRGASAEPNDILRVGDLSGSALTPATAQVLLDDIVSALTGDKRRAFRLLQPVRATQLLIASSSWVARDDTSPVDLAPAAADDAIRIRELLDEFNAPSPDLMKHTKIELGAMPTPQLVTIGDAVRTGRLSVQSGYRLAHLPAGSTRLITPATLRGAHENSVDLLVLTAHHPLVRLTEPDDVVFTTAGKPAAIVDADGGSVVAYPARILRVPARVALSPRAIADAINNLPAGSSKWRTWQVPMVRPSRESVEDLLRSVDVYDKHLRDQQTQLDELRSLLIRSVVTGALNLTLTEPPAPTQEEGP